ncbi:MAG: 30S ribosomal protein S20 [Fimbriimonadaceae bacterium]|nr:30S ribosomal protein S20 [Fimbriimonadaceae bacterium]
MANLKSSTKDLRRSSVKRARNQSVKTSLKTYAKKVRKAVEEGDKAAAEAAMVVAQKQFDKAAQNGVIHKNRSASRKSSLARAVASME